MHYAWQSKLKFCDAAECTEKKVKVVCALVLLPVNTLKICDVFLCKVVKCSANVIKSVRRLSRNAVQAIVLPTPAGVLSRVQPMPVQRCFNICQYGIYVKNRQVISCHPGSKAVNCRSRQGCSFQNYGARFVFEPNPRLHVP